MGKVITGGAGNPLSGNSKRGLFIAGLVVGLLVIGGGLYWLLSGNDEPETSSKKDDTPISQQARLKPIEVSYVQMDDESLASKVNYLIGTRQYAEAEKLITVQDNWAASKTKLNLLLAVQNAAGKTAEANETAKKIEALGGLGSGEYIQLAEQQARNGNNAKAVEYYRKAIDVLNNQKRGAYLAEIKRLETKIKELE
jgi:hypothetical protein